MADLPWIGLGVVIVLLAGIAAAASGRFGGHIR